MLSRCTLHFQIDKLIYIYRKIKVYDNTQRGHIILHKLPLQLWQETRNHFNVMKILSIMK